MQPTRMKILRYLEKFPSSSAREISRYLDMTSANIRYHLEFLVDSEKVQVSGERPTGGAGRPILLYTLTPATIGMNLVPLIEAALESINENISGDTIKQKIAENLTKGYINLEINPVSRFNQALDFLNSLNYHASWEAHPEGPQIELRHCPYGNLAHTHPDLCQIDKNLVSFLFETPMEQIRKRSFDRNPYSPCIFQLSSEPT
jgi:predicted ArsR family transcriptional regulator